MAFQGPGASGRPMHMHGLSYSKTEHSASHMHGLSKSQTDHVAKHFKTEQARPLVKENSKDTKQNSHAELHNSYAPNVQLQLLSSSYEQLHQLLRSEDWPPRKATLVWASNTRPKVLGGMPASTCRAQAISMPCCRGQQQDHGQAASSGPSPTAAWLASQSAAASRASRACADGCFSLHACQ